MGLVFFLISGTALDRDFYVWIKWFILIFITTNALTTNNGYLQFVARIFWNPHIGVVIVTQMRRLQNVSTVNASIPLETWQEKEKREIISLKIESNYLATTIEGRIGIIVWRVYTWSFWIYTSEVFAMEFYDIFSVLIVKALYLNFIERKDVKNLEITCSFEKVISQTRSHHGETLLKIFDIEGLKVCVTLFIFFILRSLNGLSFSRTVQWSVCG